MRSIRLVLNPAKWVGAGLTLVATQVMTAAHRPDIPGLANQDPSGAFGDLSLPTTRFVLLGDSSITAPGVDPISMSWPQRVAHRLADQHHIELVSVAVGGAKTRDVLRIQVDAAIAAHADIALVSVGANDALRGTTLTRFEREVEAIVSRLAATHEGVGLAGIGDLSTLPRLPTFAKGVGKIRARSFDKAIARVSRRYPTCVKASAWGGPWEGFRTGDPKVMFAEDQFHASADGHALLAGGANVVVDELLRRRYERPGDGTAG